MASLRPGAHHTISLVRWSTTLVRYRCPRQYEISSIASSYCTSGNSLLVEMSGSGRVGESLAAGGLGLVVEADREVAVTDAPGLELAGLDPLVDHVVADVETLSEVVNADLFVAERGR